MAAKCAKRHGLYHPAVRSLRRDIKVNEYFLEDSDSDKTGVKITTFEDMGETTRPPEMQCYSCKIIRILLIIVSTFILTLCYDGAER